MQQVESLAPQVAELNRRLNEFEDRSRRENLIFHGVADSVAETWAQSEDFLGFKFSIKPKPKCDDLISRAHKRDGRISRAHRLGRIVPNKSKLVIVRFLLSKPRETILSSKSKLKTTGASAS